MTAAEPVLKKKIAFISKIALLSIWILLGACQSSESLTSAGASAPNNFGAKQAKENLAYAMKQYLKMIRLVEAEKNIEVSENCPDIHTCAPRSIEHEKIFLEQRQKWTNGFYPGVLWMLLNHNAPNQTDEHSLLMEKALLYTDVILEEANRKTTHDLGMILHFPVAYALQNKHLDKNTRILYEQALTTGRDSLATRYNEGYGTILSWSWPPKYRAHYIDSDNQKKFTPVNLSNPWQYPVIIDNMMNLEFLLTSEKTEHRHMAFRHASNTMRNHFFYEEDDDKNVRPIAYHVFDYGEKKPGNWQGLGNRSAWARGQGWAIYGFTVSSIYAKKHSVDAQNNITYDAFVEKLYQSLEYYLSDEKVPLWDFFADRDNAYDIASNTSSDTARFHNMFSLCVDHIPEHITPYSGFNPITFPKDIISENGLDFLSDKKNRHGGEIIQGNEVVSCGRKPYTTLGREFPRDTSAAALYASALYRMADFVIEDTERSEKYESLADSVMTELSERYRTDIKKDIGYKLGFVLDSATGNLPRGTEIDTGIVYGDYFFIEANIYKLKLTSKKSKH